MCFKVDFQKSLKASRLCGNYKYYRWYYMDIKDTIFDINKRRINDIVEAIKRYGVL